MPILVPLIVLLLIVVFSFLVLLIGGQDTERKE